MAVRRLYPDQPASFAFTPENLAWAKAKIAEYPLGKQASAVIPLLWRAQEQDGWVTRPMIESIAGMLGMADIRVLEVATFYTMFQLAPVGAKAHVQVCGTTPCMLRGAEGLKEVCRRRIHAEPHHLSEDGAFSWEEVECLGACVNAPMVQVGKDTWEDLTPETFEQLLDGFAAGRPPKPGPMIDRQLSAPEGGETTLTDPKLFDGSMIGSWRSRFEAAEKAKADAAAQASAQPAGGSGAPASAPAAPPAAAPQPAAASPGGGKPELLTAPRGGKGDDLKLIWGVAEKLEEKLNAMGIWHFDQIAKWTPANVAWFEAEMQGFAGRVERDKWIEQCQKLASGWRPDKDVGERPKD
ncbi:MAG: NADH-quinone oxidoreductase subunit NuoE [Hyphomicrobiaceae bacterium]